MNDLNIDYINDILSTSVISHKNLIGETLFVNSNPAKVESVEVKKVNNSIVTSRTSNDYKLDSTINIEVVKKHLNNPIMTKLYLKNSNEYKTNKVDFEKTYVVYYKNDFKLKEIINERFISNLYSLNQKIGAEVYFTIKNGNVYIAFDDKQKYFNIDINKTSIELTKEYQNDVENIYSKILEIKKFIDTVILTFS